MTQYRIVKKYKRCSEPTNEIPYGILIEKTEEETTEIKPSLIQLISYLDYTFYCYSEWSCKEVEVYVKRPDMDKEKLGIELSYDSTDVLIIIYPLNEIDKTKSIIPDSKFIYIDYPKHIEIKNKYLAEQKCLQQNQH